MPHNTHRSNQILVGSMHVDVGKIESVRLLEIEVKLTESLQCKLIWTVILQVMLKHPIGFLLCAARRG